MKILFKALDYLIAIFMGTGTVFLVSLVVHESWNMALAMVAGMFLGMAVLVLAVLLFIYVSTAFELFPAGMVITMFTGMAAGMAITMMETDLFFMLMAAVFFSVIAQFGIDMYNMKLQGDVTVEN